jgi:hypothetical protein
MGIEVSGYCWNLGGKGHGRAKVGKYFWSRLRLESECGDIPSDCGPKTETDKES